METSKMIRQLRRTAKKHENDKLHTFDTDISLMCTDVANRLEKLEKEKQESRAKVIDECAERFTDWMFEKHGLSQVDIREINEIVEQLKVGWNELEKGKQTDF